MPHHHVQHAQNAGPILFTCKENIAYIMPHVNARHACIVQHAHAGKLATLCIRGVPGITYGCAICAGQRISMKINRLTF